MTVPVFLPQSSCKQITFTHTHTHNMGTPKWRFPSSFPNNFPYLLLVIIIIIIIIIIIWCLLAMWKKASSPCLSRRIQQKVHCRRRSQRRVNLRCRSVSSEDSCSLKRVEPSGSKTTASPKSVSANSTQLNSTSPTDSLRIRQANVHRILENSCLEENEGNGIITLRWMLGK